MDTPTAAPPPPPPPAEAAPPYDGGPRVDGAQMRDLSRMRRSRQGRTVAGVAAGLGRQLDVDPTVVKVGFVVLTLFGGAGIVLYLALWLLIPDEATERAIVHAGGDLQRVLVISAVVVAAFIVLGHGWGGWWFGSSIPLALLLVAVVAVLLNRDHRRADVPHPASPDPTAALTDTAPLAGTTPVRPARPVWAPPPYTPPAQRRPRRTGLLLLWPTLALLAIGLGALGVYDARHAVVQAAYPALALALVGLMLVIGAFRGRPGGLVLIGLVSALVLGASSAIGGFHEGSSQSYAPATGSDVRSSYTFDTGEVVLDLSRVADVTALDGREVRITGGAGAIEVVVPRGVRVDVDSVVKVAGGYAIGDDRKGGGFGSSHQSTLAGPAGAPTLHLDLSVRVGQITVRHQ